MWLASCNASGCGGLWRCGGACARWLEFARRGRHASGRWRLEPRRAWRTRPPLESGLYQWREVAGWATARWACGASSSHPMMLGSSLSPSLLLALLLLSSLSRSWSCVSLLCRYCSSVMTRRSTTASPKGGTAARLLVAHTAPLAGRRRRLTQKHVCGNKHRSERAVTPAVRHRRVQTRRYGMCSTILGVAPVEAYPCALGAHVCWAEACCNVCLCLVEHRASVWTEQRHVPLAKTSGPSTHGGRP